VQIAGGVKEADIVDVMNVSWFGVCILWILWEWSM